MKHLLLALLMLAMLVIPIAATNLNFQNPGDNTSVKVMNYNSPLNPQLYWVGSTYGLNNYIVTQRIGNPNDYKFSGFALNSPSLTSYAAATLLYSSGHGATRSTPDVALFDSSGNLLYLFVLPTDVNTKLGRWEVKLSGGTAYLYINGVKIKNSTDLAQNPAYIAFGTYGNSESGYDCYGSTAYWDDYVYGDDENKIVLGLPETNGFIILDDITNDAADGLFNLTSSTQQESTYMYGTFSRGNSSTAVCPLFMCLA